jgi:uncharacterized protein (DUF305 family)
MSTTALASAIIGFLLGGLVVSIAAQQNADADTGGSGMTMSQMSEDLEDKTGDAYDAAFLASMIDHHRGALDMAKLSATRTEHPEIQELSEAIIDAQEREIAQMRSWQKQWGYDQHTRPEH